MQLELATVQSCTATGCVVRPLGHEPTLAAGYAAAVVDRIRIRRGDLVAIDMETPTPTIVWRWRRAELLRPVRALEALDHVLVGAAGCAFEAVVTRPDLQLEPGDVVFVTHTADGKEVFDRAVDGEPEHPDSIRREWFPRIEAAYADMDAAA